MQILKKDCGDVNQTEVAQDRVQALVLVVMNLPIMLLEIWLDLLRKRKTLMNSMLSIMDKHLTSFWLFFWKP
jgi:hypothetical protein